MATAVVTVMAVALGSSLAVPGCSSDGPSDGRRPSVTGPSAHDASGLQPPGSTMVDGLVVPKGAHLAGAVFRRPSATGGGGGGGDVWEAHLVLDGDPFAAWDAMARQLRTATPPVSMPGSADSCVWQVADDAPDVDPTLALLTITAEPPDDAIDGVECSATAGVAVDGPIRNYSMELHSGPHAPTTMSLQTGWSQQPGPSRPTALRASLETQAQRGDVPRVVPTDRAVPAGAAAHVPHAGRQPHPEVGEGFGAPVNCFLRGGYHQLEVPSGASFVAGGFKDSTVSVLAVGDAEAAIRQLDRQARRDGPSQSGGGSTTPERLSDGRSVARWEFSVDAGGGACGASASPDGRFLLVEVHGD